MVNLEINPASVAANWWYLDVLSAELSCRRLLLPTASQGAK